MQQEFITVTFNRTKIAIRCADILYVIMSDDHCTIHMFDESVYRCRMTLKELKKQLNEGFMEVKRGCMIAVSESVRLEIRFYCLMVKKFAIQSERKGLLEKSCRKSRSL